MPTDVAPAPGAGAATPAAGPTACPNGPAGRHAWGPAGYGWRPGTNFEPAARWVCRGCGAEAWGCGADPPAGES